MSNISLQEFLSSLPKDEQLYYKTNPGNAGDSLIATGAYQLFKKYNLNVISISDKSFDATDKIVFYAGGGNLTGIYPDARIFFDKNHIVAKQLIMLPHTVMKNEDLLAKLGSNVTIFARENVSYKHLLKYANNANIYIDHDLAVNLDANEILDTKVISFFEALIKKVLYKLLNSPKAKDIPSVLLMLNNTAFELRTLLMSSSKVGIFFRDDVESNNSELPDNNADLSRIYEYGTHSEYVTFYTTHRLMSYLSHFSKIQTDRLHVCIAAALLGKQVEFHPNSYFKCKAVYEHSLKDRFPNIIWVDN